MLLWVEARLGALLASDSNNSELVGQERLPDGEYEARAFAKLTLGFDPGEGFVRRCDLSADLFFDHAALGSMFLDAMALLDCPRYKRDVISATGSDDIETIYWRTARRFVPVLRVYDKGVQSGSHTAGVRVRIERQWQPSRGGDKTSGLLATADLGRAFAGPLHPWLAMNQPIIVASPNEALLLLRDYIGKAELGGGRILSERVAERMMGTLAVLQHLGDGFWENSRTATRRRAELRKVGLVVNAAAPEGLRLPLQEMLRSATDAWDAPFDSPVENKMAASVRELEGRATEVASS